MSQHGCDNALEAQSDAGLAHASGTYQQAQALLASAVLMFPMLQRFLARTGAGDDPGRLHVKSVHAKAEDLCMTAASLEACLLRLVVGLLLCRAIRQNVLASNTRMNASDPSRAGSLSVKRMLAQEWTALVPL